MAMKRPAAVASGWSSGRAAPSDLDSLRRDTGESTHAWTAGRRAQDFNFKRKQRGGKNRRSKRLKQEAHAGAIAGAQGIPSLLRALRSLLYNSLKAQRRREGADDEEAEETELAELEVQEQLTAGGGCAPPAAEWAAAEAGPLEELVAEKELEPERVAELEEEPPAEEEGPMAVDLDLEEGLQDEATEQQRKEQLLEQQQEKLSEASDFDLAVRFMLVTVLFWDGRPAIDCRRSCRATDNKDAGTSIISKYYCDMCSKHIYDICKVEATAATGGD